VIGAVPGGHLGAGAAVNTTLRQLGGALGVALLGSLLSSVYVDRLGPQLDRLPSGVAEAARGSVVGAAQLGDAALRTAAGEAFTDAMAAVNLTCAGVALAGAALTLRFLPARADAA
jgi:hypothetical protein